MREMFQLNSNLFILLHRFACPPKKNLTNPCSSWVFLLLRDWLDAEMGEELQWLPPSNKGEWSHYILFKEFPNKIWMQIQRGARARGTCNIPNSLYRCSIWIIQIEFILLLLRLVLSFSCLPACLRYDDFTHWILTESQEGLNEMHDKTAPLLHSTDSVCRAGWGGGKRKDFSGDSQCNSSSANGIRDEKQTYLLLKRWFPMRAWPHYPAVIHIAMPLHSETCIRGWCRFIPSGEWASHHLEDLLEAKDF